MTRPAARPGRLLGAFLVCGEHLDPGDPDFLRVFALNAVIVLLGTSGLVYAAFNGLVIGTPEVMPLVVFDLAAFATALGIGVYLRHTRDIARSAVAADLACLVAFVLLVAMHAGGHHFTLWAMVYPPIAFMLRGPRRGAVHAGVFLVILFALAIAGLGRWDHGYFDAVALSNLVGATLVLTGLVAVYEAGRRHAAGQLAGIRGNLQRLSTRDGLTGLYNRRHFDDVLPRELARSSRERRRVALLLLDIDHFKDYNDTHGHPAGDEVLRALAGVLTRAFRRAEDLPFRVGGEEFAVLCHVRDAHAATRRAESVRAAVEALGIPRPSDGAPLTVSVGYDVSARDTHRDPGRMYARADEALYRAKRGGRNRVEAAAPPED